MTRRRNMAAWAPARPDTAPTYAPLGLEAGDVVKVRGESGATFKFRSARQERTGVSLEFFGGRKGYECLRAFAPDRIVMPGPRLLARQRKARKGTTNV